MNRYGSIAAEIYDLDKPLMALPDTAFHLARFAGHAGPLLEPGCGSGRTLVPFLQAGHDITGFDASAEMLARCRERCAAAGFAPDLSVQRFEEFSSDRLFTAILLPASSFTLIDDFATAVSVLGRFHRHLCPGGVIVLDLQSLTSLAHPAPDCRRWLAPNGDLLTCEGTRVATDWTRQRIETLYRYERWRDHVLVETQIDPMAQRFWGVEEFRMALETSGFDDVTIAGGYRRSRPLLATDQVLTFEARAGRGR